MVSIKTGVTQSQYALAFRLIRLIGKSHEGNFRTTFYKPRSNRGISKSPDWQSRCQLACCFACRTDQTPTTSNYFCARRRPRPIRSVATMCHKFMTLLKIVVVNGSHGVWSMQEGSMEYRAGIWKPWTGEYLGIFVLLWRQLHYVAFVSGAHYTRERELYASENAI